MSSPLYIKISGKDNVAVAVGDIPTGALVMGGARMRQDTPQAHKIALYDIPEGGKIVRYGMVLRYATNPIGKGQWINEKILKLPTSSSVDEMKFTANLVTNLPEPPVDTWEGYINPSGGYTRTRNILSISTTVQCITGVLNITMTRMKSELLPKYPNAGDIAPINRVYGCSVAINIPEVEVSIHALRNLAKHPNFGGELVAMKLGCEEFAVEMLLGQADISPSNVIILQEKKGFDDMINSLMEMTDGELARLNQRGRQTLPLPELLIGMQCGGSDAFSSVTANPNAGCVTGMLIKGGATVLFSEVTEVRDNMYLLGERCVSEETGKKLTAEMKWCDHYLENGQVDRSTNPTPGNKKGGFSNIMKKAMGSTAKSGISSIVEVPSPAEKPSKKGLIYAATPTSDIVCGPCQPTSGIGLQVFVTGRGTPYGLAIAPVIKMCSGDDVKMQWQDLIDVNASPIATRDTTIQDIGAQLFHEIVDVVSGRRQSHAEKYRLHDDLCIFDPMPIAR